MLAKRVRERERQRVCAHTSGAFARRSPPCRQPFAPTREPRVVEARSSPQHAHVAPVLTLSSLSLPFFLFSSFFLCLSSFSLSLPLSPSLLFASLSRFASLWRGRAKARAHAVRARVCTQQTPRRALLSRRRCGGSGNQQPAVSFRRRRVVGDPQTRQQVSAIRSARPSLYCIRVSILSFCLYNIHTLRGKIILFSMRYIRFRWFRERGF